jgi:hypothetical protein
LIYALVIDGQHWPATAMTNFVDFLISIGTAIIQIIVTLAAYLVSHASEFKDKLLKSSKFAPS